MLSNDYRPTEIETQLRLIEHTYKHTGLRSYLTLLLLVLLHVLVFLK